MSALATKVIAYVADFAAQDEVPVEGVISGDTIILKWSDGSPTGITVFPNDGWVKWSVDGKVEKKDIRNPNGYGLSKMGTHLALVAAFTEILIPDHLRQKPFAARP